MSSEGATAFQGVRFFADTAGICKGVRLSLTFGESGRLGDPVTLARGTDEVESPWFGHPRGPSGDSCASRLSVARSE
jgi:hypothetical protein